jgi:hypothetical protein
VNRSKLNPAARRFARALVKRFPRFRQNLSVEEDGDFETFLWSPPGSNAGALVCQSFRGDVWVRFAPGQTGCCCESVPDLLNTVRGLLTGKLVIARSRKEPRSDISAFHRLWNPLLKRGETVAIYSGSSRSGRKGSHSPRLSAVTSVAASEMRTLGVDHDRQQSYRRRSKPLPWLLAGGLTSLHFMHNAEY